MRQRGTNQTGNLLNLGRVDPKGSSDNISGQTKDCWTKERVSITSGGNLERQGKGAIHTSLSAIMSGKELSVKRENTLKRVWKVTLTLG